MEIHRIGLCFRTACPRWPSTTTRVACSSPSSAANRAHEERSWLVRRKLWKICSSVRGKKVGYGLGKTNLDFGVIFFTYKFITDLYFQELESDRWQRPGHSSLTVSTWLPGIELQLLDLIFVQCQRQQGGTAVNSGRNQGQR